MTLKLNKQDWFKVAIEQEYIKLFDYSSFANPRIIGKGGFGSIYIAHSKHSGNFVALKCLHNNISDNDDTINAFIREVKTISKVNFHDNIVRLFGITQ
ncbi:17466_t:CDS:2, partial [Cetraspora pellucida]